MVDDEEHITELLAMGLGYNGFEVERQASGRGALGAIEARRPDLVVLDVMLPDLDGFEVARRLRRAEGHLRSVIAMIEAERPCLELAQQMHAVEKAVGQAKKALIEDHLDHCLDTVVGPMDAGQRQEIADFKAIAKYL